MRVDNVGERHSHDDRDDHDDHDGVVSDLAAAFPAPTDDELRSLRSRLAADADTAGLLDVAYRIIDSPVGALLVAMTDAGLVRVAFEREGHDTVLAELAAAVSPRVLSSALRTDGVARQLDEYFAGQRSTFDVPVDLRLASGFRRTVLSLLPDIAYGSTASYAAVARSAGNPRAVRAVGSACANNPVPLVVPCHRVVRSDGGTGQYRGGADVKLVLLQLEGAA